MSTKGTTTGQRWVPVRLFRSRPGAAVFAANGRYGSPTSFVSGFRPAMGACAGLALTGAVAGLLVSGRRTATPAPVPAETIPSKIEIRS